jgi:peptidyl-prolyl cis-trans isomerase C
MLIFSLLSLLGLNLAAQESTPVSVAATDARESNDIIAKVGDQPITYAELNTLLNSSAIVGLSVPALGTPERNRVRITLLDKAISANLLYLDALKHGVDQDPSYRRDLQRFSDGVLSSLYRQKYLIGDIEVSEAEIRAHFERSNLAGQALTDDLKLGIEAAIRKARFKARAATLRERLRQGVSVVIEEDNLDPHEDDTRSDRVVMARIDGVPVVWKDVKDLLQTESRRTTLAEFHLDEDVERLEALERHIDLRIMASKGRAAGLESDPVYQRRLREYRKNRLTILHRENLIRQMEPNEAELWNYYEEKRDRIRVREARKIQMVVLDTRQQAESLKARIEAGELTLYEAARDHSIDPNAGQTLGEMGWVGQGTGFPALDELTFSLGPDELGGPVESPAGWHLVKVLDQREARFEDIVDAATRQTTRRRYLHEKLDAYVVDLRKHVFPVVVYADNLDRLFKAEAEWIADLERQAQQSPKTTQQRLQQLNAFMQP